MLPLNQYVRPSKKALSSSQLGAKGAGEAGTTGAVGAVLNAVNDAIRPLGAAITELPMTPERLLAALNRL